MSNQQYVKVLKDDLDALIGSASCAHSMLGDVHCYDTEVYDDLGEILDKIEYEDI